MENMTVAQVDLYIESANRRVDRYMGKSEDNVRRESYLPVQDNQLSGFGIGKKEVKPDPGPEINRIDVLRKEGDADAR